MPTSPPRTTNQLPWDSRATVLGAMSRSVMRSFRSRSNSPARRAERSVGNNDQAEDNFGGDNPLWGCFMPPVSLMVTKEERYEPAKLPPLYASVPEWKDTTTQYLGMAHWDAAAARSRHRSEPAATNDVPSSQSSTGTGHLIAVDAVDGRWDLRSPFAGLDWNDGSHPWQSGQPARLLLLVLYRCLGEWNAITLAQLLSTWRGNCHHDEQDMSWTGGTRAGGNLRAVTRQRNSAMARVAVLEEEVREMKIGAAMASVPPAMDEDVEEELQARCQLAEARVQVLEEELAQRQKREASALQRVCDLEQQQQRFEDEKQARLQTELQRQAEKREVYDDHMRSASLPGVALQEGTTRELITIDVFSAILDDELEESKTLHNAAVKGIEEQEGIRQSVTEGLNKLQRCLTEATEHDNRITLWMEATERALKGVETCSLEAVYDMWENRNQAEHAAAHIESELRQRDAQLVEQARRIEALEERCRVLTRVRSLQDVSPSPDSNGNFEGAIEHGAASGDLRQDMDSEREATSELQHASRLEEPSTHYNANTQHTHSTPLDGRQRFDEKGALLERSDLSKAGNEVSTSGAPRSRTTVSVLPLTQDIMDNGRGKTSTNGSALRKQRQDARREQKQRSFKARTLTSDIEANRQIRVSKYKAMIGPLLRSPPTV